MSADVMLNKRWALDLENWFDNDRRILSRDARFAVE
jgi:hypothetical protein